MQAKGISPLSLIVFIVFGLTLAACSPAASTPTQAPPTDTPLNTIDISGSGSVSGLLTAVKESFESDNAGYILNVLPGTGTGGGVEGVVDGTLDLAAMARAPRDTEIEQGIDYFSFGAAGVALITHPDVGVTELSSEQALGLLTGEIDNWSAVGGEDLPVALLIRSEDESATIALRASFLGEFSFPETATLLATAGDMVTSVEGVEGAIGFGNYPSVIGAEVTTVALDGVLPDQPDYSVTTPLGLGWVEAGAETAEIVVTWLSSEAGRTALAAQGVILPVTE